MTTIPPTVPARGAHVQNIMYFRKTLTLADAAAGVKIGALPPGAFVSAIKAYNSVVFNAGTTNGVSIGSTQGGTDFAAGGTVSGTNILAATLGYQNITAAPGLGLAVTGGATPTGSSGAWDVWVKYLQTGTVATTGSITIVIEFETNNDQ
jgi:hypothetical protein